MGSTMGYLQVIKQFLSCKMLLGGGEGRSGVRS